MNVIQFRARMLREENIEDHVRHVRVTISEAEVQEAFEDLLVATRALREAQDAMNRAHDRYARLAKGRKA